MAARDTCSTEGYYNFYCLFDYFFRVNLFYFLYINSFRYRFSHFLLLRKKWATVPETKSIAEYAKNGARTEINDSNPPIAGPETPPTKKAPLYTDWARPRCSSSTDRMMTEPAATENIDDPRPPAARKKSSWW